ncbi:MAG: SDR family NAD(P)-dependent oxidoreductase [Gemmatimonadetes bacterium]|nr:SDR family NAD(P)-dependent oxidoreductase [Gemmatimonadota bacterium]
MALTDRNAVVIGGGRGIGAAVARALAEAGAGIVVAARTVEAIERVAAGLRADGHRAWPVRCDVTDPHDVQALVKTATEYLDHVDILVNSAGIASSAPVHKLTLEEWNTSFAVNATGTFLCTQAFLPQMLASKWGRIVNVVSVAGLTGSRYVAAYSASKHAAIGFTRCVAAEVAAHGVTANAVCPGFVDTDMTTESIDRIVDATGVSRDQALEAILETTPQRRLFTPEEVAHTVLALCDDNSRGINGQAIVLDGGGLLA